MLVATPTNRWWSEPLRCPTRLACYALGREGGFSLVAMGVAEPTASDSGSAPLHHLLVGLATSIKVDVVPTLRNSGRVGPLQSDEAIESPIAHDFLAAP